LEIKKRKLEGVFEIALAPILDSRGFFMRAFDSETFEKAGLARSWKQENHSRSEQKGIIRGLHFQFPPFSETKLVRCIRGAILDVFVDLRLDSPTFGQWDSIELSEENKKLIFIPRGFAHGFCTLSEVSEVLYKVDNVYNREHESGLLWSDPDLSINWPVKDPVLSPKDEKNQTLKEFITQHTALRI
jgi:dTDP-4-dehydrorhamnose 3,5-epimerase